MNSVSDRYKVILLDAGSIANMIKGDNFALKLEVLKRTRKKLITTEHIMEEVLKWNKEKAGKFLNWGEKNGVEIVKTSDMLGTYEGGKNYGVTMKKGKLSQVGDASIKWLFENSETLNFAEVRILSNDRNLAKWAKEINNNGPGFYHSVLELWGEEVLDGRLTTTTYQKFTSDFKTNRTGISPEWRSLLFSEKDISDLNESLEKAKTRGVSVSRGRLWMVAAGAEILRQAGVAGDIYGFAVTATRAAELHAEGKSDEAEQVWAGFLGDFTIGTAGATAGSSLALAALAILVPEPSTTVMGFTALIGALIGGYAGATVGEDFGIYLAKKYQEMTTDGQFELSPEELTAIREEFEAKHNLQPGGYIDLSRK